MWHILLVLMLMVTLLPSHSQAATVPVTPDWFLMSSPWRSPGENPCRNSADCTPSWAVEAMFQAGALPEAVRDEFLAREADGEPRTEYWIESGDKIRVNTYSKAGVPYIQEYMHADFADGEQFVAYGHQIYHDDLRYDLVLVAAGGNWVLLVDKPHNFVGTTPPVTPSYPIGYVPISNRWYGSSPPLPPSSVPPLILITQPDCILCVPQSPEEPPEISVVPPSEPPENPPVIPLPGSLVLLLTALATLFVSSSRFRRFEA